MYKPLYNMSLNLIVDVAFLLSFIIYAADVKSRHFLMKILVEKGLSTHEACYCSLVQSV